MQTQQQVIKYYTTLESKIGYGVFLKGIKHFGYYPNGQERISINQAQILMIEKLAAKLNLSPNSYILDAGCGEGFTAIYLAEHYGYHVYGIDLLDFNINRAKELSIKKHLTTKIKFQKGDYMNLPFANNMFDAVYTMEALVHAPDYHKTLTEFRRVLKPDGKLVLFEYTMSDLSKLDEKGKKTAIVINDMSGMHSLQFFVHGSFPKILREVGFVKVSTETITSNIIPMLKKFYKTAKFPYYFIKLFGLQKYFINTTGAVETYKRLKNNVFQYVIVEAQKS